MFGGVLREHGRFSNSDSMLLLLDGASLALGTELLEDMLVVTAGGGTTEERGEAYM